MPPTWNDFQGVNAAYVAELYDRFERDRRGVDPALRRSLEQMGPPPAEGPPAPLDTAPREIAGRIDALIDAIRRSGHLAARLDPLGSAPDGDPSLNLETHALTESMLAELPASMAGNGADHARTLLDAIERLRAIYCGSVGYQIDHVASPAERRWLRDAIEGERIRDAAGPADPGALLDRLTRIEAFERFLQRTFPGRTRFSIEGLDMLVPMLDAVVADAVEHRAGHVFVGMAHRGRLNVLVHVLGVPYASILAEFAERPLPAPDANGGADDEETGDVIYHRDAVRDVPIENGSLRITLPPNPSHLEAVDPVVEGMARAAGTRADRAGAPLFDAAAVLPVLIHGDAAMTGQGVVTETLNLQRLRGYTTGGTVHIIANNRIGFTTDPRDASSLRYPSDVVVGFGIPVVHVDADDVKACLAVIGLALAYRREFQADVLVDLVGYRRYGHNEGDEPSFTQPREAAIIGNHPTVRELWAGALETAGTIAPGEAQNRLDARLAELQQIFDRPAQASAAPVQSVAPAAETAEPNTAVPLGRLRELNASLLEVPDDFAVHRKLERSRGRHRHALDEPDAAQVDWALAETLALGSVLADGVAVRLTGQDTERGTFSQRHAVLHDARDGRTFAPLQAFPQARAACEIVNSPLSENAALGFEFGYDAQARDRLVLWEAQYGDFVNGAQVIVDEFLVSARSKWGQRSSLVLLLPHGLEGRGPDHASARPERWLQLAADGHLRLVNCTRAAQYFHVLRRQAALLRDDPTPLVVLTPKSLLRHALVGSRPRDLSEGRWQPLIADDDAAARSPRIRRLIFCSGKTSVDLLSSPRRRESPTVAISSIEQLYPLPVPAMQADIDSYPGLEEVAWLQEEPENMGAWDFVRPVLERLAGRRRLKAVARPRSASPSEGSETQSARLLEHLVACAFEFAVGTAPRRLDRPPNEGETNPRSKARSDVH